MNDALLADIRARANGDTDEQDALAEVDRLALLDAFDAATSRAVKAEADLARERAECNEWAERCGRAVHDRDAASADRDCTIDALEIVIRREDERLKEAHANGRAECLAERDAARAEAAAMREALSYAVEWSGNHNHLWIGELGWVADAAAALSGTAGRNLADELAQLRSAATLAAQQFHDLASTYPDTAEGLARRTHVEALAVEMRRALCGKWSPLSEHLAAVWADAARYKRRKDEAYEERNRVVALLCRIALGLGWKAGIAQHVDDPHATEPWDPEWRTLVSIDLPTGQASWHMHDSQRHLVADLPAYEKTWDGHDTAEKYRRVEAVTVKVVEADVALTCATGPIARERDEHRARALDATIASAEALLDAARLRTALEAMMPMGWQQRLWPPGASYTEMALARGTFDQACDALEGKAGYKLPEAIAVDAVAAAKNIRQALLRDDSSQGAARDAEVRQLAVRVLADRPFWRPLDATVRLHTLIAIGLGDADEADVVRDDISDTIDLLCADERMLLCEVSGSLYGEHPPFKTLVPHDELARLRRVDEAALALCKTPVCDALADEPCARCAAVDALRTVLADGTKGGGA